MTKTPAQIVSIIEPAYKLIMGIKTPRTDSLMVDKAMIAGGALRSLYFDHPINDIDVFVHTNYDIDPSNRSTIEAVYSKVDEYNTTVRGLNPLEFDYIRSYADEEVQRRLELYRRGEVEDYESGMIHYTINIPYEIHRLNTLPYTIQFVCIHQGISLPKYVDTFDLGINQLFYDGARFRLTGNFNKDVSQKTLTWYHTGLAQTTQTMVERLHKMQQKFPDYTMVVDTQSLVDDYKKKKK